MPPLTEGETTILLRLADNAAAQTQIAGEQALLMQQLTNLLQKVEERLEQLDVNREDGKLELKAHVTQELKAWRHHIYLALVFITMLVVVVEVLDISVERWLKVIH